MRTTRSASGRYVLVIFALAVIAGSCFPALADDTPPAGVMRVEEKGRLIGWAIEARIVEAIKNPLERYQAIEKLVAWVLSQRFTQQTEETAYQIKCFAGFLAVDSKEVVETNTNAKVFATQIFFDAWNWRVVVNRYFADGQILQEIGRFAEDESGWGGVTGHRSGLLVERRWVNSVEDTRSRYSKRRMYFYYAHGRKLIQK
jgi:hypothetical protein